MLAPLQVRDDCSGLLAFAPSQPTKRLIVAPSQPTKRLIVAPSQPTKRLIVAPSQPTKRLLRLTVAGRSPAPRKR
jgi:hypothetical protein